MPPVNANILIGMWGRLSASALWRVGRTGLPYLVVAVAIFARNPTPLLRSEFWAEDATEFFFEAIESGLASIVTPVFGYYFLLERGIAYVATLFPVTVTPGIYAWSCYGITVAAIGYFSRPGFAWLVPSYGMRLLVCGLIAIGPGTAEVLLNLANLPSVLTVWGLFLLLEKPFVLRRWKWLGLAVIGFSAGHAVVLAPVILYLWYQTRDSAYGTLLVVECLIFAINVVGTHVYGSSIGLVDYSNLWGAPFIVMENVVNRLLYLPLLGPTWADAVVGASATVYWSCTLGLGLGIAIVAYRRKWHVSESFAMLAISYLSVVTFFAMIVVARSYSMEAVSGVNAARAWNMRYAFLPAAVSTLIWVTVVAAALRAKSAPVFGKGAACVGLGLMIGGYMSQWGYLIQRPDLQWRGSASKIEEALQARAAGRLDHEVIFESRDIAHPVWTPANGRTMLSISP